MYIDSLASPSSGDCQSPEDGLASESIVQCVDIIMNTVEFRLCDSSTFS